MNEILPGGPLITAFDVATAVGCCDGRTGVRVPRVWTWRLDDAGKARPYRLAFLRRLLDAYFAEGKPDRVVYEKPMPLGAIMNAKPKSGFVVSDDQMMFLRGAIGVLESCAANAGIPLIEGISVQDARQHLTGQRRFERPAKGQPSPAKLAVQRIAGTLGIVCETLDEADAFALWEYDRARANPRLAHITAPLFR